MPRYPIRRRFQRRRRFDGGSRRENRGDHSGSDGEQKASADEDGESELMCGHRVYFF